MSGNKLLAENTIRRFMKLANTEAMADTFMEAAMRAPGMRGKDNDDDAPAMRAPAMREEEEVQEESFEIEDLNEEEDEEMELDAEMGAEMDEEPMDDEPEMGAADMSLTEEEARLLIDLGERLAAAMDEGAEEGEDLDAMGDMEDLGDAEPEEGEEPEEEMMQEEQDELVNEVLKRVTKRLVAAKLNRK